MEPIFFSTPEDFRKWLEKHHEKEELLWVGYYKKATGIPSMTWSESVDQALCFGWIDGLRKSVDNKRYKIRFTPRRPTSNWSAVNIKKMEALTKAGLMRPEGLAAYAKRKAEKSKIYSYEQDEVVLDPAYKSKIKAHPKAWQYFDQLAPSYKKASIRWVMSAKREETRLRRLRILIESSEGQQKIPQLRPS